MGTENKNSNIASDKAQIKKVRMAYTLNNSQPVQCTLVSDQPFFYIDEDVCIDDDVLFGDDIGSEEYSELEQNLLAIKSKIDAYENLKSKESASKNSQKIENNFAALNNSSAISQDEILSLINQSRFVSTTLDILQKNGLKIEPSDIVTGIEYNKATQSINIGHISGLETAAILFSKALRVAWQDFNNAHDNPLNYFPDHAVLMHRMQKADEDIFAIRAAWELRLIGETDLWDFIENSSLLDLGRAFGREALSDFRTLNNGRATAAAFETWFLSDRVREEDQILIQHMLDFQEHIEMDKVLSEKRAFEAIGQFGAQPYGKNYLMPYANMIMTDTLFTELRDRANANFLWFIKFERSFTQTEQSLQSDVDNSNGGGNSILSFAEFTHKDETKRNETVDNTSHDGNNLICVDFGNDETPDDKLPQQF